jgi:hypothetical protein
MPSVGMNTDISSLIDATISGNTDQIIAVARELTQHGANASELIGRVGMIAAHGDHDGHTILTLDAASMMCRWLLALQYTLAENTQDNTRGIPLLVQALTAATPALRAGKEAQKEYPVPLFPSGLAEGQTVNSAMHDAVFGNDRNMVERLILGLYGTGADYRTMQIRVYDSISTTFQYAGHPLMFAVRGMQLLDAVEWGDRAPNISIGLRHTYPCKQRNLTGFIQFAHFFLNRVIALPVTARAWLLQKKNMRSLYAV